MTTGGVPRAEFDGILKCLVQAGYGKRVMFGSDQMVWPDSIPIAIASITEANYLTTTQKRDILYNNAARFLRLTLGQMAKHRGLLVFAFHPFLPLAGEWQLSTHSDIRIMKRPML